MSETGWTSAHAVWTVNDVAELLHVNRLTVYRWLREGTLQGFQVGAARRARWRITQAALDDFVARRPNRYTRKRDEALEAERVRRELAEQRAYHAEQQTLAYAGVMRLIAVAVHVRAAMLKPPA